MSNRRRSFTMKNKIFPSEQYFISKNYLPLFMIRSSFLILCSGLICLLFSSSVAVAPPDPAIFSNVFIETIKKNDQQLFVKTFEITEADFQWIVNAFLENPYQSEKEKELIQLSVERIPDAKTKMDEMRLEDFKTIQQWIVSDTINISTIELVDFFYELKFKKDLPFHIIKKGALFIKHGTKYYIIYMDEIAFINNKWRYERISRIEEVPQRIDYTLFYEEEDAYPADDFIPVYDTVAAPVDTLKIPEQALTEKQSEKADKIQKKINALYLKQMNILYKEE